MITLRIIAILSIVLMSRALAFADDEAFGFYVEACRHSGYNPAEIKTFQAQLTVVSRMRLPHSSVENSIKQAINSIEIAMKKEGKSEKEIQEAQKEHGDKIRKSLSGEASSRFIRVFIDNSATQIGLEDTLPKVIEVDVDGDASSLFQINLGLSTGAVESRTNISQSALSTTIDDRHIRGAWYYTAGRIGPLDGVNIALRLLLSRNEGGSFSISEVGIASYRKDCEASKRTFTLSEERVKYEGDNSAYLLQVYEKGGLRMKFLIDPDRGYICPKAQIFDHVSGDLRFEVVSENFILDEHSQKLFPEKAVYTIYLGAAGEMSTEFRVEPRTLVINRLIPDSAFAIEVREGGRVDDLRRDDLEKITFIANQPGKLDLPTVATKSLDEIEWLTPKEVVQPYEPYTIEPKPFGWVRIALLAVGIIMIIWGLILLFFKRRIVT